MKEGTRTVRKSGSRKDGSGEISGYTVEGGLKQLSRGEGQRRGSAESEGDAERGCI